MQAEEFKAQFDVSPEIFEKLEAYHRLLFKWQKAINLISSKTLQSAWGRHFSDSAQLLEYIPEDTNIVMDLGSGAGFPGLVLAIMRPDLEIHLVESDERKAQFLRTVSRETSVDVKVHNQRIESSTLGIMPDLITARALADLGTLFEYCLPWTEENPAMTMLFLKGRMAQKELLEAQKRYKFKHESHESITSAESMILLVSDLKRI